MAGRRTSLAALAGAKVDDVPGRSDPLLLSLPLDKLIPTRFNPRRRFGTDDDLRDFGEKLARKQLQPAVVVSRAAYLKLWPEESEHIGAASYVIANGERRWRASRLVGRPTLEVVHKEEVAESRATFLDAVQSENNDREDLDPIERALGIDIMVTQLGGANQVAAYYKKTAGWVSQQRKLLKLTPELQDLVSAGEMPIRVARDIAGLPHERQPVAWEEHLEQRRIEKEAAAQLKARPAPAEPPAREVEERQRFTAVNSSHPAERVPAQEPAGDTERFTAVNTARSSGLAEYHGTTITDRPSSQPETPEQPSASSKLPVQSVPEPRPAAETPKQFPYNSAGESAFFLTNRMDVETMLGMWEVVGVHLGQVAREERNAIIRRLLDDLGQ
ncbi:ParB/RepB/Spo0J family partition protein [Streptomyces griseoincarnatus]